jgi:hypothetical protein
MVIFKKFYLLNETNNEVISRLQGSGYEVKAAGNKIKVYTRDNRQKEIQNLIQLFSDKGAAFLKPDTKSIIRLSSTGVVSLSDGTILIVKPLGRDVRGAEKLATNDLDKLISEYVKIEGKPIIVKIGDDKFENIVKASSEHIKGNPKADIALINDRNIEVAFISHKKGGGAMAFQSYSGLGRLSGLEIYSSPIVKSFVKDVTSYLFTNYGTNQAPPGTSFKREIPNDSEGIKIIGKAVYGSNWTEGGKSFERNFVNCIGQGNPELVKVGDCYELSFSEEFRTYKDVSWAFSGEYKAYLGATYRLGRSIENDGFIANNLRGVICPISMLSRRKVVEI